MTAQTARPRNATPTALRLTAAEILQTHEAGGRDNPWAIIAAHLRNNWIKPGTFLACVAGHGSGVIAPFSAPGETDIKADAVAQARGNLIWYPSAWIVTSEGAERVFDLPEMTGEIYPSGYDGRHRTYTRDVLPFDALPAYVHGGPALVALPGWATSSTSGTGIDGYRVNIRRVDADGRTIDRHELDGTTYPTLHDADRVMYDAGAVGFFVQESDRLMYGLH